VRGHRATGVPTAIANYELGCLALREDAGRMA